jgi:mono/diheme cytochrome c family protein
MRPRPAIVALICLAAGLGSPGVALGDAESGKTIAKRWCGTCHIVPDAVPEVATEGIPTFRAIARNPRNTPARIAAILVDPHPPMPDFSLSNRTIADLIAYIESLAAD